MKKRSFMRLLSVALAAVLLVQPAMAPVASAEEMAEPAIEVVAEEVVVAEEPEVAVEEVPVTEEVVAEETEEIVVAEEPVEEEPVAVLQDADVLIPADATNEEVQSILGNALFINPAAYDLQAIEWEYQCEGTYSAVGLNKNTAWGSIFGFTSKNKVLFTEYTYNHPALAANKDATYSIRIKGSDEVVKLTKSSKKQVEIVVKEDAEVKIDYSEDGTVDYSNIDQKVFEAVIESSTPELALEDMEFTFQTAPKTQTDIGGAIVGTVAKQWVPLSGRKDSIIGSAAVEYPGVTEGTHVIRVTFAGNDEYFKKTVEVEVSFVDRLESEIVLAEGVTEVGMAYTDDSEFDIETMKTRIFNAVVVSSNPELTASDVTMKYNATLTGATKNWQNLESTGIGSALKKFGLGEQTIQISWAGNKEYKPVIVEVKINVTDSRQTSVVVLKEGVSITYNMDAYQMKKEIFNNVIDWNNSTLPAKDAVTIDDFVVEYYGENSLGVINGGVKQWAPIEGGMVNLLQYPQMSVGEQKIRVKYNGMDDYRPSARTEGSVTVNKARVSVRVKSTSIYANDPLPADFITTNPADNFDTFTVFTGVNSDVELNIYVLFPEKFTDNAVLKLLDPIVKAINGKTFTEMLADGMSVGELRKFFNTQELLDVLKMMNIDLGTLGQVMEVINKMPGIADGVRVGFGVPNRAGLYNVTTITDNNNYTTGLGMGTLLVRMRSKGTKLNWNQTIPDNKLTAEEAANFDFGVTLSYDGDVTVSQKGVKYLYSGFTSKWRIYSSTTKAPTEPGSYIVTVVTLGGNYIALPITRTFRITK